jgi:Fe-S cluster assembly protein SufB
MSTNPLIIPGQVPKPILHIISHLTVHASVLPKEISTITWHTYHQFTELKIKNEQVTVSHEARVGKIGEEEIFFLQSRGLSEQEAIRLVVSGFIEPIVKALPVEYALELNKLIELEMEGAVG